MRGPTDKGAVLPRAFSVIGQEMLWPVRRIMMRSGARFLEATVAALGGE